MKSLTFSPWAEETTGRFEYVVTGLPLLHVRRILRLVILDTELYHEIVETMPQFAPNLNAVRTNSYTEVGAPWLKSSGQTPSIFRKLVTSCLRKAVATTRYGDDEACGRPPRPTVLTQADADLVSLDLIPWSIPSKQDLLQLESTVSRSRTSFLRALDIFPLRQLRYSAAAVAVRFLESVPRRVRMRLERIVLEEDHLAVGFSECHGLGLIPFCQENPQLRIERKVDLWRNTLHMTTAHGDNLDRQIWFLQQKYIMDRPTGILQTNHISYPIAVWIMEALELEAAGMPPALLH
ncbi:hypothetical protein CMUS01_10615 [Colletotrichum musicola]|uniref:Uncharacterized protein n=1 Tax=Colletotrichum musicola TaxID=2175873 RepID=A0A8H6N814_9PEZI|nr:hypothetical protein CMUS01_10615 [Colletotrichum musicola]